jgi:hypothetical protein
MNLKNLFLIALIIYCIIISILFFSKKDHTYAIAIKENRNIIVKDSSGKSSWLTDEVLTEILTKSKEPKIASDSIEWSNGVFRLITFPSFGDATIIRVEKNNDSIVGVYKVLNIFKEDKSNSILIAIKHEKHFKVSFEEWDTLTLLARKALFWDLRSQTNVQGTDGENWYIEGARDYKYNHVLTQDPTRGCLAELGYFMKEINSESNN